MPTTDHRIEKSAAEMSRRSRVLVPVAVFIIAVLVAIAGAIFVIAEDDSPRDVVASFIAAAEAEDLWGVRDTLDPDIVVTFDGTPGAFGRDAILRNIEREWSEGLLTFDEVIIATEDDTVTTALRITLPDGSTHRHEVTYHVSGEGLIYLEEHVVLE